jgi:hypothetical protein
MSIIGNGDIASVLKDREDRIYFASGVSNSRETRESEYQREINLLLSQDKGRHLVYFSSLSVFYSDTRYSRHKKYMEELVKKNFEHYTIIRIGNINWGKNPHTLLNFLRNKIFNNESFTVKDSYRYIINMEEFLYWIDMIPSWNCEMNISGKRMKVVDIVEQLKKERTWRPYARA